MIEVIELTPEQAQDITGPASASAYLQPFKLKDGKYALPIDVLEDSRNNGAVAELSVLPVRQIEETDIDFPVEE